MYINNNSKKILRSLASIFKWYLISSMGTGGQVEKERLLQGVKIRKTSNGRDDLSTAGWHDLDTKRMKGQFS